MAQGSGVVRADPAPSVHLSPQDDGRLADRGRWGCCTHQHRPQLVQSVTPAPFTAPHAILDIRRLQNNTRTWTEREGGKPGGQEFLAPGSSECAEAGLGFENKVEGTQLAKKP